MTSTPTTPPQRSNGSVARRHNVVALVAAVIVGVGEAFVGVMLAAPGQGEWDSALVVAAIAFGTIILSLVVFLRWLRSPRATIAFVVTVLLLTVPAVWWTSNYGLSLRMGWDTGATDEAKAAIAMESYLVNGRCGYVSSGSVGPLSAPLNRCVYVDPVAEVMYQTDNGDGLIYVPGTAPPSAPDLCIRHLSAGWWEIQRPLVDCPDGYHFVPGG